MLKHNWSTLDFRFGPFVDDETQLPTKYNLICQFLETHFPVKAQTPKPIKTQNNKLIHGFVKEVTNIAIPLPIISLFELYLQTEMKNILWLISKTHIGKSYFIRILSQKLKTLMLNDLTSVENAQLLLLDSAMDWIHFDTDCVLNKQKLIKLAKKENVILQHRNKILLQTTGQPIIITTKDANLHKTLLGEQAEKFMTIVNFDEDYFNEESLMPLNWHIIKQWDLCHVKFWGQNTCIHKTMKSVTLETEITPRLCGWFPSLIYFRKDLTPFKVPKHKQRFKQEMFKIIPPEWKIKNTSLFYIA